MHAAIGASWTSQPGDLSTASTLAARDIIFGGLTLNTLRIYFSALWQDSSTPCEWALCSETNTVLQHGLSPLTQMPKSAACIGMLAADRVLTFTTAKPPGNKRRWQSALPFIAEEHSLTDPDELHVVPASGATPDTIAVSVITKSWLRQIVTAAADAGLPLRRLVAETLMPALPVDSWTLVWNGQHGFLRTSFTTGLALDSGNDQTPPQALLLSLAAAGTNLPQQIQLRFAGSATVLPSWDLSVPLLKGECWDWRCAPISAAVPNLLWGDFAPPIRLFDQLSRLRPSLFILLAVLTIEIIGTPIEWVQLAQEKRTLTQQIEKIFHHTFGDASTLVDAPLQMQRNLAALRHATGISDSTDFLPLLDSVAPSVGTTVKSMNYESGKVTFDLKLEKSADVAVLEKKLRKRGLKVLSSEMHDLGDGIEVKLILSQEGMK